MYKLLSSQNARERANEARQLLKGALKVTKEILDEVSIPHPRAVVGRLIDLINALEVSLHLVLTIDWLQLTFWLRKKTDGNASYITDLAAQIERLSDAVIRPLAGHERKHIPEDLWNRVHDLLEQVPFIPTCDISI